MGCADAEQASEPAASVAPDSPRRCRAPIRCRRGWCAGARGGRLPRAGSAWPVSSAVSAGVDDVARAGSGRACGGLLRDCLESTSMRCIGLRAHAAAAPAASLIASRPTCRGRGRRARRARGCGLLRRLTPLCHVAREALPQPLATASGGSTSAVPPSSDRRPRRPPLVGSPARRQSSRGALPRPRRPRVGTTAGQIAGVRHRWEARRRRPALVPARYLAVVGAGRPSRGEGVLRLRLTWLLSASRHLPRSRPQRLRRGGRAMRNLGRPRVVSSRSRSARSPCRVREGRARSRAGMGRAR